MRNAGPGEQRTTAGLGPEPCLLRIGAEQWNIEGERDVPFKCGRVVRHEVSEVRTGQLAPDLLEQTGAEARLVQELEDFGIVRGELRGNTRYYDDTEREIVRAVTELARYGVAGRNLRVFRTSAEREAQLLQQILAPALRSRNPERRKEAIDALENLAAVASHLKHLLLVHDLRRIAK